ncbi:PleD family two-component system response regulator [Pedobacter agri]|uniref:response regulator n=1 Tax=Pedobacter agri TaxID=454586 RepID=UPI002931E25B|nr:response regulator [Pedobacter agri]
MSKKVLVIDDDRELLWLFQAILQQQEIQAVTFNTGIPLEKIIAEHPDLIMLDVNIIGSEKNGTDICKEIKESGGEFNVPVLLVSGENDLEVLARCCGADDFIAKPFDIDYLMNKIKKHLT